MMQQHVALALLACAGLFAAGYAQLRLSRFTAGAHKRAATRVVLIAIGLAIGYLGARMFAEPGLAMVAFVIGFGVVHVPAACILLLKGLRGEAPS